MKNVPAKIPIVSAYRNLVIVRAKTTQKLEVYHLIWYTDKNQNSCKVAIFVKRTMFKKGLYRKKWMNVQEIKISTLVCYTIGPGSMKISHMICRFKESLNSQTNKYSWWGWMAIKVEEFKWWFKNIINIDSDKFSKV